MTSKEEWRTIPDSEEEVSNFGRVRLPRKYFYVREEEDEINRYYLPPKILEWDEEENPVVQRDISKEKSFGFFSLKSVRNVSSPVCDLVARTFLGKRPFGYYLCHLDKNKKNNNLENLKYISIFSMENFRRIFGN